MSAWAADIAAKLEKDANLSPFEILEIWDKAMNRTMTRQEVTFILDAPMKNISWKLLILEMPELIQERKKLLEIVKGSRKFK